MIMNSRSDW